MHCKDCKYWDNSEDLDEYSTKIPGIGECRRFKPFWDATGWSENFTKDGHERILLPGHEGDLAFVQDGSDYVAYFLTKAEFGCVQFEYKGG